MEKSQEDWNERQLFAQKRAMLQTLEVPMQIDENLQSQNIATSSNAKGKEKGFGKGKGKGKGESTSSFSQRRPNSGNFRNFGKDPKQGNVQGPPKFSATIYCKFCKKKGHYEDQCWTKERLEKKKLRKDKEVPPLPIHGTQTNVVQDENPKKRKVEQLHIFNEKTWSVRASINGLDLNAIIDSGATISAVSKAYVSDSIPDRRNITPIQVGSGETIFPLERPI